MSRLLRVGLMAFVSITMLSTGCTKNEPTEKKRVVRLAIWSNYLSADIQEKFTKETGIEIQISNYSSNEELLAKIQSGGAGIDVAVPSDYMVDVMAKLNLLERLDNEKIPNKAGLDSSVLNQQFDPQNHFSLPYAWTTAGIAVNRELYKGKITGWKDLFTNPDLAGKISLLDDVREVTAAALKMHGYSVNTTNPDELKKAQETLMAARSRIKMFRSDTIDPLLNKEIAVAQAYSADALQAAQKSPGKIEYILPEEGGTRAIDNLVVVKGSANPDEAHALINFLLSEEANVAFVKAVMGGPVVVSAKDKLPEDVKSNTSLFPSSSALSKFEAIRDVGEATRLYDRLWTEVKAN